MIQLKDKNIFSYEVAAEFISLIGTGWVNFNVSK